MEAKSRRKFEIKIPAWLPIVALSAIALLGLASCMSAAPIVEPLETNGPPCRIVYTSSSGYFGAIEEYNEHPQDVTQFSVDGNNLSMMANINSRLVAVRSRYGAKFADMQTVLEQDDPKCDPHEEVIHIANDVPDLEEPMNTVVDRAVTFIRTSEHKYPHLQGIEFIPDFRTVQGKEVEIRREQFIDLIKKRFKDDALVKINDISTDVVCDAQGQFDKNYLIEEKDGRRVHLVPIRQKVYDQKVFEDPIK